jgi:hypothetical protein
MGTSFTPELIRLLKRVDAILKGMAKGITIFGTHLLQTLDFQ